MKSFRRAILICYFLAVTLSCVWVPWRAPLQGGVTALMGYGWLWSGPTESEQYRKIATIDYGRLALELVALTAIFGILVLVASETDNASPHLPDPSGMPEGRIAFDPRTKKPLAKVQGGKWVPL